MSFPTETANLLGLFKPAEPLAETSRLLEFIGTSAAPTSMLDDPGLPATLACAVYSRPRNIIYSAALTLGSARLGFFDCCAIKPILFRKVF